jgi:ribosomal protein L21E
LTFHSYFNGVVQSISNETLLVSGRSYKISPMVKVLAHENRNGAMYETSAKMSELSTGDSVTVRIEASMIKEIIIERWRR